MAKRRAPYVHVTQEFLHALTLYGRLSPLEWSILMVVLHYTAGWNKSEAPVGFATILVRLPPGSSEEGVRRALKRLSTPAAEERRGERGHGILRAVAPPDFCTPTTWSIDTDWQRWGWDRATLDALGGLEGIAERMADYQVAEVLPETWSREAEEAAVVLRSVVVDVAGPHARVPGVDHESQVWRRWCLAMDTILSHNVHATTLEAVILWAAREEFWRRHLSGMETDRFFVRNYEKIAAQWRAARTRRSFL